MKDNPYAAPHAQLLRTAGQKFSWKSALATASIAFAGFPLIVVLLSAARGMAPPDFLINPGFLVTLALVSFSVACILERTRLWTWLNWLLAVVATVVVFGGLVVFLHKFTR